MRGGMEERWRRMSVGEPPFMPSVYRSSQRSLNRTSVPNYMARRSEPPQPPEHVPASTMAFLSSSVDHPWERAVAANNVPYYIK